MHNFATIITAASKSHRFFFPLDFESNFFFLCKKGKWCGLEVAIKKLFVVEGDNLENFIHELKLMSKLRHPNIVILIGMCIESGKESFIMDCKPSNSFEFFECVM